MRENNYGFGLKRLMRQRGLAALEFSYVAVIFFTLLFGIIEVARAFYICNTLQEVTRRAAAAAATTDFTDLAALHQIRRDAVFRETDGPLPFAPNITHENIRIDYLAILRSSDALTMQPVDLPAATPALNRLECMRDPNSNGCIRLVRVRICAPGAGASCQPVPFVLLLPLVKLAFNLPTSTTVRVSESLGYAPGARP